MMSVKRKIVLISGFLTAVVLLATGKTTAQPRPVNRYHKVILEMNDSPQDFRALSLLLDRPEITVTWVLFHISKNPDHVALVDTLEEIFQKEGILVFPVRTSSPDEKETARVLQSLLPVAENADKPVFLFFGTSKTGADYLKVFNEYEPKFEKVIWYRSDASGPDLKESGLPGGLNDHLRIDILTDKGNRGEFIAGMAAMENIALKRAFGMITETFGTDKQSLSGKTGPELAVVYLTNPELFDTQPMERHTAIRFCLDYSYRQVAVVMEDMLNGNYYAGNNIVFNRFPVDHSNYRYDVREIMDSTISRFGAEEWKACVMTDEIHGHLGVFSIVGAKMGIRAREYFGVGRDELEVLSYAGSLPPYSCLNDGLQASTGATIGTGTIHLAGDTVVAPSAVFTCRGRSVRITLKKEYLEKVEADIQQGIVRYGLMDDGYWKLVRRSALQYWAGWNRSVIFIVEPLP